MQQAELCTADVSDLESLSNVVSRISPDLVVLSKDLLEDMLTKERRHVDPAEDLECALIDLRPRDADVIRMMAKGLRNHEIASSLGLRVRTVKSILSILYLRHDVTKPGRNGLGCLWSEGIHESLWFQARSYLLQGDLLDKFCKLCNPQSAAMRHSSNLSSGSSIAITPAGVLGGAKKALHTSGGRHPERPLESRILLLNLSDEHTASVFTFALSASWNRWPRRMQSS